HRGCGADSAGTEGARARLHRRRRPALPRSARAAEHHRAGPRPGHRRLRAGRRAHRGPAGGPATRTRAHRQGPVHPAAGDGAGRGSEQHELLRDADDLAGMPVVVADLHSAVPAVLAGARWAAAERGSTVSVAYVMTDGGALPAAFSRAVAGLREAGWLTATIT